MSKPLRQIVTATLSASLLLSPFFSLSVSAEQNQFNWFEQSDITLPKGTKAGKLGNAMRYVLLPTSRNTQALSIRVRLTDLPIKYASVAQTLTQDYGWELVEFNGKSVLKRDFADNKEEILAEAISQLAALFKSEEAKGLFLPSQTDLVIAGNFKNRTAAELISDNLSDWKSSEAFSAPAELSLMPKSVSDAPKQEKPTVAYTAHTSLDDTANSKQQRKKLLTVTIANKILEKRLEEAFANQDVKVEVSNQILAQSSLVSQVSLTSEDSEQAKAAQQIIEKEINRARSSGFSQVEYEMVVSQLRKELEGQTRPHDEAYTAHQADQLIKAIDEGRVYTSPSYDLDLMNFHVAHMNEYDISNEFESVWKSPMELIIIPNS
ncbi:insulinase family protein [Vibrio sinaloensis]|uniref:Peptidase M16 C-terminal domain-containing protein n=1 Tax=Photobacterium sp. (strain ATCC 43367) TaxID=379097 RepID=A0A0A5HPU9_PHOS4|nr:insulinase family protein [Vibrio sinaloensis]KGY07572.1 hypothetical protein NM06_16565 [Vibrio sinaloensis]